MAKAKEEDLTQQLIQGLTGLQSAHKQILDRYMLNTKAQLAELVDSLMGKGGAKLPTLSKGKIKEMIEELNDLKLKPEKGRGKDLYRISKLLDEMHEIIEG